MNLHLDSSLAEKYTSNSQRMRVMSEHWVSVEAFCPNCGSPVQRYGNNMPVADMFCGVCREVYELKAGATLRTRVAGGAYHTMIERLNSSTNPNFFLLRYDERSLQVRDLFAIPKHFVTPATIVRRNPLKDTARRAGWVGCTINLRDIPLSGRIYFVRDGGAIAREQVLLQWRRTRFLQDTQSLESKVWIIDVMSCIDRLGAHTFSLNEVYAFERYLALKHPGNHHVREKIRQQLQVLRDKGFIKFIGRGQYRLSSH